MSSNYISENYEPGKLAMLKGEVSGKKSKHTCEISFLSMQNCRIHVYVDGAYKGTLQPLGQGIVQLEKDYSSIYCITDDETKDWYETGNCSCQYAFQLRNK